MSSLSQPVSPAPTVLATILATSILSVIVGYYLGLGSTLTISRTDSDPSLSSRNKSAKPSSDVSSSDEEEAPSSDTKDFSDVSGDCKLVLVVRTDLEMTRGKIAAQCSHATLACYKSLSKTNPVLLRRWERTGQAKITLKGDDEEELIILQGQAQSLGITARIIHDAGRTQIAAGSATVLGIGPAPKTVIDQITGHLKLL